MRRAKSLSLVFVAVALMYFSDCDSRRATRIKSVRHTVSFL